MLAKIWFLLLFALLVLKADSFKVKPWSPIIPDSKNLATETGASALANPASTNCVKQGGQLVIKVLPSGGQYGVCFFEDNRQCEEWALLRGECPVGGRKITGYETESQSYCAISGGEVDVINKTCSFSNGAVCDTDKYFAGTCLKTYLDDLIKVTEPSAGAKITSPLTIKGEARGSWFFETSFPVKLLDAEGQVLARGLAQAQKDWMTEEFVPFALELKFFQPTTAEGHLILFKDNPSGLSANDRQIIIPVTF